MAQSAGSLPLSSADMVIPRANFISVRTPKVLVPGDIVKVVRYSGLYSHFGVYVGRGRIIHYTAPDSDFGGKETPSVKLTSFKEFLKDDNVYEIYRFTKEGLWIYTNHNRFLFKYNNELLFDLFNTATFHLYTPEETVQRAYSCLNEESYNLLSNNCEHFAIWCKTGVRKSLQIDLIGICVLP